MPPEWIVEKHHRCIDGNGKVLRVPIDQLHADAFSFDPRPFQILLGQSEEKKQQVIALGRLGWSLRRIQGVTRIRRETAASFLKAAGIAVRPPGGWGRRAAAKPAIEVTTDFGAESTGGTTPEPQPGRSPASSASEPYREAIEVGMSRGRNAMAIWQDLVDSHGFTAGYQSVKRFVNKLRGSTTPEARVVIETAPGEEAQVDYGSGPMVRDPDSGKYRRTHLFVMTLGHSQKSVGCWCSAPARESGPSCTRKRFAGWAA
jgi:hypothetical protein